jgi:RNA polymerase sigma-70 factor (ECF subfamily)
MVSPHVAGDGLGQKLLGIVEPSTRGRRLWWWGLVGVMAAASAADARAIYDQLLAVRCRRGDRSAWRELIDRWEMPLFCYLRRLVHHEADTWDVLQQTWLAAYRGIGALQDPARLAVWLHRIARNQAISHHRRHGGSQRVFEPLPNEGDESPATTDDDPPPDAQAELLDDARRVHEALGQLSLAHREVLTLHFLHELTLEEMADVLDVSVGTLKSRLHYARRALRGVLLSKEEVA